MMCFSFAVWNMEPVPEIEETESKNSGCLDDVVSGLFVQW